MTKIKTSAQVKREYPDHAKLIGAVVRQLGGTESMSDIAQYGMQAGFGGMIYYSETHKFAMRNRSGIIDLLEEQAEQFGQEVTEMVSNFGIFRNNPMDADDRKDLYKYLGGGKPEQGTITNIMAWFAAEEVARMFTE